MGYTHPRTMTITTPISNIAAPIDSSTYYFGGRGAGWSTGSEPLRRLVIPNTGVIRKIQVSTYSATVVGTAEDWEMKVRVNNTTDYSLGTVGLADATRIWRSDLNIPVIEGEFITIKTTTPAWVTNPEGVYADVIIRLDV